MQSIPRRIFNGLGHNDETEIPSLEAGETFDTVETVLDSSGGAKVLEKATGTHKQNILKRLLSRKKKCDNASKKKTRGRSIMGRISRLRSKSKRAKKMSGANTVASEEASTPEEREVSTKVVETTTTAVEESKASPDSTPEEIDEPVEELEVTSSDYEEATQEAISSESEDSDSCLEIEESQVDVVEETLVEKACFHNESSDYVGMAMVGVLIAFLASPLLQA